MKKLGLIVFITALSIGLAFSAGCNFRNFSSLGEVQGSGIQKSETRNVRDFKKIDAGGAVNVEISIRNEFGVEVQADDNLLANIKTEVSGDTLKIFSEDRISSKTKINVKISMPVVEGLDISGASTANAANVKAESLQLKASGASKITISGQVKDLKAEASGASGIEAENLQAENAEAEASGASKATISATDSLDADASGASKITYIGEPKNLKQNSSGASSVTEK